MPEKFKNCAIFSGGGTRMMIYLGIFAALEELGKKPDLLIASCGGAFAATVINNFSDNFSRKEYLKSEEYFEFVRKTRLTKEKKLSKIGCLTLKKVLDKLSAFYIEDVFEKYLVEMNQDLSADFPTLKNVEFSKEIPTIIIGSKILFNPNETGQKRENRKLYQKIIFTGSETAKKINPEKVIIHSENYKKSAVEISPEIRTNVPLLTSCRISVSDMFYVEPVRFQNENFAGGAIDLVPIELANHLAENIFIEKKQSYNKIEESFVRTVLGFSGNERLHEIQQQFNGFQIDTTDIKQKLDGHYLKKIINWQKMEIGFTLPKNYQQFQIDMEKQWKYGYEKTLKIHKNEFL